MGNDLGEDSEDKKCIEKAERAAEPNAAKHSKKHAADLIQRRLHGGQP